MESGSSRYEDALSSLNINYRNSSNPNNKNSNNNNLKVAYKDRIPIERTSRYSSSSLNRSRRSYNLYNFNQKNKVKSNDDGNSKYSGANLFITKFEGESEEFCCDKCKCKIF